MSVVTLPAGEPETEQQAAEALATGGHVWRHGAVVIIYTGADVPVVEEVTE